MRLTERVARVAGASPFPLYKSRLVRVRRNLRGDVVSAIIPRGTVEMCQLPGFWTYYGESETLTREQEI